jgi:hypothetical protein
MLINKKAVSTIILIILILCSAVFGALLSYMWVMGNFYLEPETVDLVITNVDFPVDHADYFYVTVMNPSHSPSGTNITEIYFTVEGDNKLYNVTNTSPESLPILLEKGTSKTIRCVPDENWGQFAGKTIAVHVSATNASGAEASAETKFVKLEVATSLNATVSCKQFNVTIRNNPQSAINLTLTNIEVDRVPIENASLLPDDQNVTFPMNLFNGTSVSLRCLYNWETITNPTIRVETSEKYYAEASTNATATILLLITNVVFNETKPDEISITVLNSEVSSTPVDISDIVLTYRNGTQDQQYHINGTLTIPQFAPYYRLGIGNTTTFNHCIWNWTNYRDQNVTITVNVKQGFTPASETRKTPQPVIFKITGLNFNLTETNHFLVKIANMPCSLRDINITKIKFNENETTFETQIIPIGAPERIFNCNFSWTSFRGKNVTITAYTKDGLSTPPETIMLPSVDLKILVDTHDFAKSTEGIPYVNITIINTLFSNRTVKVTQIIFKTENMTDTINGALTNPTLVPNEYILTVGANVTILCPWNWTLYPNQNVTITVQTAEGFSISQTFQIPPTP